MSEFPVLLDTDNSRCILEGIFYRSTWSNFTWKDLPRDFPCPDILKAQYRDWKSSGLLERVVEYLDSRRNLSGTLLSRLGPNTSSYEKRRGVDIGMRVRR